MAVVRVAFLLLLVFLTEVDSRCLKKPIIFNFGDSNSDTGGRMAGLGVSINLPNGRQFFRRSTGRLSDGRLIIDFLCGSLSMKFLSPYLEALGSDFSQGANFAIIGSATQPKLQPFSLRIQVLQFLRFKARSLELAGDSPHLIGPDEFQNALYMFDIGQNDLSAAFSNMSYQQVLEKIPSVLKEIKGAIKKIHDEGGKNFWIHNTGPLGCLPKKLALNSNEEKDQHGCIKSYNDAAKAFNVGLRALCKELRSHLGNATIVYVDMYSIKYDLIANSAKYGVNNPLMACCGYGGPPYNYNVNATCGHPPSQACTEGLRYVNWDGSHYTEAASAIITSRILSTDFSEPRLSFDYFCHA
ncbi:GDSL esterase/lipase At1g09390-like [Aristolochia californica]|uniref:GDSL esterase/lipase At1g09390-like n=1 Tax=Aristolochia californica TaxID=171875 RepID=UPI0035DEC544